MTTSPIIRVLELGLVAGFALHIYTAIVLTKKNQGARPQKYAYEKANENSSWFSRNMGLSGLIVVLFLFLHLYNFWYAYKFNIEPTIAIEGSEEMMKDMHGLVVEVLGKEWYLAIYILAFVLLGFHLNHGFQSAFQTLGLYHRKYTPAIKGLGSLIAVVLPLGFIVVAIACYLK